jgi:hypothetical protein
MSCATCRHFRRAIGGRLGYCAIHRSEGTLTGDELRACWQSTDTQPEPYQALFRDIETAPSTLHAAPPSLAEAAPPIRVAREIPRGLVVAPTVPPSHRGRSTEG